MKNMFRSFAMLAVASLILLAPAAQAQFGPTGTTTVSVVVGAEASIRIDTVGNTNLTSPSTFAAYAGTTNYTYKVRTGAATTAAITLQMDANFGPAGGPTVANLSYTPSVSAPGTAPGVQAPLVGSSTPVAGFGNSVSSALAGNAGAVAWSLINDPSYAVGTYTAGVTFTISII